MQPPKLKVATIVGTRPELIKLSATIQACDDHFDQILIHTGQNWDYTLNEVFFQELGIRRPDHYLEAVGGNLGETVGNIISKSYDILQRERPDALLVLGDTNSALSTISAKRLKIPIFHMEAGNRCFDENLPEEVNRRIVDHISDINLPYTEHARRNLLDEGIRPDRIFVTGSPMAEILARWQPQIAGSDVLSRLELHPDQYFLVSAHREENIDDERNFNSLMAAIGQLAEAYGFPVIFSTHPRTLDRMQKRNVQLPPQVRILQPFGFFDYNRLQMESFCVLSDSGTLAEESAILRYCAVSIRSSTERPEVVDKGTFVLGGVTTRGILQGIAMARSMKDAALVMPAVGDYLDDNVSAKVARIIQGFTQVVDDLVWRKARIDS